MLTVWDIHLLCAYQRYEICIYCVHVNGIRNASIVCMVCMLTVWEKHCVHVNGMRNASIVCILTVLTSFLSTSENCWEIIKFTWILYIYILCCVLFNVSVSLKRSLDQVIMNIIGYYLFIIVSLNNNNDVFKYIGWGLWLSKINNKSPTNPTLFFWWK